MASLVICLCLCGCSYIYHVHLEGVVLRASDQSPITSGEVTLLDGTKEIGRGQIGSDGTWDLTGEILSARNQKDENGVCWLDKDDLIVRIEVAGQRYEIPCPKAVQSNTDYHYYAYVLAVIDVPLSKDSRITK